MPEKIKNVFISHIHEDDDGLGKLKDLLKKSGLNIRDYSINSDNPNNAKSEKYIKSDILAPRISACGAMIVYITPETKKSDYVNWEIEYAVHKGLRIVGVWAHDEKGCEVPEGLEKYADAIVGWQGAGIVNAVEGKADGWENPDGTPSTIRDISRYSCGTNKVTPR